MQQPIRFRRIKVRITRSGWLYIGVTLLIGAAAVNTANNLLYLITAGLLALMALSGVVAMRALRHLELELMLPREWFAQRETPVRLAVSNRRRRLPSYLLRLAREKSDTLLVEVPAGGRAEGSLTMTFARRGRHPLGEILVTSAFPFAFFHRGGIVSLAGDVLVYPKPVVPPREALVHPDGRDMGSGAARRGVGGDFWGIRPYVPGDAIGRVDWKAWSRLGVLTVKEFEEESAPPLLLTLESVPGPGLEERLSQLTGLILEAGRQGRPIGLSLSTGMIEPGLTYLHREQLLRTLALFPGGAILPDPQAPRLARLRARLPRPAEEGV